MDHQTATTIELADGTRVARECYVIRSERAGVYIGYPQGPGRLPETDRYYARHVWRWAGALGTTALAAKGPGTGSSVGPWVIIDLPREQLVAEILAQQPCIDVINDTTGRCPVALESA